MQMDIRLPGEAHPAMDLQTIAGIVDSGLIGEELGGRDVTRVFCDRRRIHHTSG